MSMIINVPAAPLLLTPHVGGLEDEVLYGSKIDIIEASDYGFSKVMTEYDYEGYIHNDNFIELSSVITSLKRHIITSTFADVMPEPNIKQRAILNLPRGSFVFGAEKYENGWSRVLLADASHGYIRSSKIRQWAHITAGEICEFTFRQNVLETAFNYFDAPYRWGGKTPVGIDCSGLAFMAHFLNGITIYRNSSIEHSIEKGFPTRKVALEDAKMGDLLYFPGHIAIYLGGGRFIHSSHSNDGVAVNSLNADDDDFRADLKETLICAGTVF